jgi:2-polyprenyl-3-methyl-5-hydroxy-6-metoxy-1,4-benzoquinol methylase
LVSVSEKKRLEAVARDSTYVNMAGKASTRHCATIFERHFRGNSCLELGPAEGVMTAHLIKHFAKVTVVEGSETFAGMIAAAHPEVHVHHGLIEAFAPRERYDTIVLGHVLEHVEDPSAMLQTIRGWLAPGGRILASVPNANSIHRQAAVLMGILGDVRALNAADVHHGHRRVYDPETFRALFQSAGLTVDHFGGYWLKPLSNAQIEQDWTADMLQAFMRLGEGYPDIAAEIYVVASHG